MNTKENPQDVINKFAKRQRYMPYIIGGLAGVLVLVGVLLILSVAT
jgi:predicted nucleic acid-binding Zn ribbon protein